ANAVGNRGHHLSKGGHALAGHELVLHRAQLLVGGRELFRLALERTTLALDTPGRSANDPEQAPVERGTARDRHADDGHLSPPDVGEDTDRLLVSLHDPDGRAVPEDDGDVDLDELATRRLVLVFTLFVHFAADRGVAGQRRVELGVVGEDLAEETWLVRPHDTLAGVVDLHSHDLRHDDRTQVELEEPLPRLRGLWLREVGRRQVVDRLRSDEVRRRAPLSIDQVLLKGA